MYNRVLRYAGDIYTELILRFAKSINNHATTLFKAKLSPHATGAGKKANGNGKPSSNEEEEEELDTEPKKLEWKLTPELRTGIRFAETRLSDLICQNDIVTLEFDVSFHFHRDFFIIKPWLITSFVFPRLTENPSLRDMDFLQMLSYRWLSKQPTSRFMVVQNVLMNLP